MDTAKVTSKGKDMVAVTEDGCELLSDVVDTDELIVFG